MKRLSWKYVAGLIDGEGCLDFQVGYKKFIRPRVRVTLTTAGKDVIVLLHNNYGGHLYERKTTNPNWSNSYSWELCGYKEVCMFLRNIVNHLIIKKEQARLLLWMESNIKGKWSDDSVRQIAKDELKAMKQDSHRLSEEAQEKLTLAMR